MKYRIFASLLLVAILAFLAFALQDDEKPAQPTVSQPAGKKFNF